MVIKKKGCVKMGTFEDYLLAVRMSGIDLEGEYKALEEERKRKEEEEIRRLVEQELEEENQKESNEKS